MLTPATTLYKKKVYLCVSFDSQINIQRAILYSNQQNSLIKLQ
jgi:hypothetical protein